MSVLLLLLGPAPEADEPAGSESAARFERHAVAADHPAASQAGAEVLAQGGSAADAAAATMLALGVANPASSGLGGGGFALYWDAQAEELTFLDFREEAPGDATPDMYEDGEPAGEGPLSGPSQLGGLASGVPGEPAGIEALLERFGELPRDKVVAPALRLARDGIEVTPYLAKLSKPFTAQMKQDRTMRRWFEEGADQLQPGQTVRQPELARTLEAFARSGAKPFYSGAVARRIVAANRRAGGIMKMRDLRAYEVVQREPLEAEHFGHRWTTAPLPSAGGFTMLQSLALLERWKGHWKPERDAALLHALAESWKGPFLDRQVYAGDTDHVDVPMDRMMASRRLAERAKAFHPTLSMPPADYELPIEGFERERAVQPESGGTSHLCVVDADGNVASVTTTINLPFGARYTAAGMVMNDELDDFAQAVGEQNAFGLPGGAPNLPGPGKRPVSTMSPSIVFDDDGPVLCVGASGGSRIVTATQQAAFNAVVLEMDAEAAVSAPRVHHQGRPNQLRTETGRPLPPPVLAELMARGHDHEPIERVAVVQAIHIDRSDGNRQLEAVSDPRKGGQPAGE